MEKMRKKKGDTGRAILFLAPALLLICCFTVIPIFEAVYTSFHKTQYAMVGEFVGLKNYISVMVRWTEKYNQFNCLCSFIPAAGDADRYRSRNSSEPKD